MDYRIRELLREDYGLLEDFLYEAIFVPEGAVRPSRSILERPELKVYVECFGARKADMGLIAEVDGKAAGAVWVRVMNDYGHIDDMTPSFAISLYKEYRGFGIGTALMKAMVRLLKRRGYTRGSLAVQKANYAVNMYKKVGFRIVGENQEEYIMLSDFSDFTEDHRTKEV